MPHKKSCIPVFVTNPKDTPNYIPYNWENEPWWDAVEKGAEAHSKYTSLDTRGAVILAELINVQPKRFGEVITPREVSVLKEAEEEAIKEAEIPFNPGFSGDDDVEKTDSVAA